MRGELRAVLMGALIGLVVVSTLRSSPAQAAWAKTSVRTSNPIAMASLGHRFTPVQINGATGTSAGTGGDIYRSTWFGIGSTVYFDLTDTSSVTNEQWGTVSVALEQGITISPTVTIWTCNVNWNVVLNSCATGARLVAGPYPASQSPQFKWGDMAPGSVQHLQVLTTGTVALMNVAAVSRSVTRPGMNRTSG